MSAASPFRVYRSPTMGVLAGLGMASGLPYVLANDTLKAWLSRIDVDVATIGYFSLVTLPYALKFLWAPLMDRYAFPGLARMGRRRSWLGALQVLMAVSLVMIGWLGPAHAGSALWPVTLLATALVLFSASQDVNADAYRADVLRKHELGAGAAAFISGYRVAMIVGGGFALVLASSMSWGTTYQLMGLLMAGSVLITCLAPKPATEACAPTSIAEATIMPLRTLLTSHRPAGALFLIVFVLVFRLPDTLAQAMTMPLLIQGLKFNEQEVGYLRQMLGFFVTIMGALSGGGLIARFGVRPSLVAFGLLQVASNAGFLILAMSAPSRGLMAVVICVESFCNGLVAAGFVAFLMSRCDPRYSATQYALFTGLMALATSLSGAITGVMVRELGYAAFFAWTMAAGVPGMLMLPFLAAEPMSTIHDQSGN